MPSEEYKTEHPEASYDVFLAAHYSDGSFAFLISDVNCPIGSIGEGQDDPTFAISPVPVTAETEFLDATTPPSSVGIRTEPLVYSVETIAGRETLCVNGVALVDIGDQLGEVILVGENYPKYNSLE